MKAIKFNLHQKELTTEHGKIGNYYYCVQIATLVSSGELNKAESI